MGKKAAGEQRYVFGHGKTHTTHHQHEQQAEIGKVLDIARDQCGQRSASMHVCVSITLVQDLMNLIDGRAALSKLSRHNRLARADRTSGGVVGAIAIEQVLMPLVLLASAIAIELCEQLGMLLRNEVGLVNLTREAVGVERNTCGIAGAAGTAHAVNAGDHCQQDNEYRRDSYRTCGLAALGLPGPLRHGITSADDYSISMTFKLRSENV